MVGGGGNGPSWVGGWGVVTIIGGITRCRNFRIFQKEDFEDHELGRTMLRNELRYGLIYIGLGLIGVFFGWQYPAILTFVSQHFSQLDAGNPEVALRWVSYIDLLLDIIAILPVDVRYRHRLLRQLTSDTDLEVTPYGGIRLKHDLGQKNPSA